jgi:ribosomal protein S18 acetylase RimI-like enzyme
VFSVQRVHEASLVVSGSSLFDPGRGIGAALVTALRELAYQGGCYGLWAATDHDNEAAQRTYRAAGATDDGSFAMLL